MEELFFIVMTVDNERFVIKAEHQGMETHSEARRLAEEGVFQPQDKYWIYYPPHQIKSIQLTTDSGGGDPVMFVG